MRAFPVCVALSIPTRNLVFSAIARFPVGMPQTSARMALRDSPARVKWGNLMVSVHGIDRFPWTLHVCEAHRDLVPSRNPVAQVLSRPPRHHRHRAGGDARNRPNPRRLAPSVPQAHVGLAGHHRERRPRRAGRLGAGARQAGTGGFSLPPQPRRGRTTCRAT